MLDQSRRLQGPTTLPAPPWDHPSTRGVHPFKTAMDPIGSSLSGVGNPRLKPGHSRVEEAMMPPPQGSRSCPGIGSDLALYRLPAMESVRGPKAAPDSLHGVSCWPSGRAGLGFGSSRGRHGRGADGPGMQVGLGFRPTRGNAGAAWRPGTPVCLQPPRAWVG
jgi:hypothetical protein